MTSGNSSNEPISHENDVDSEGSPDDSGIASAFARALLSESESGTAEKPSTEGDTPSQSSAEKPRKLESLDDLAETLGLEAAELYSIKVPRSNGEPLTLGELKDRWHEWSALEDERVQWNEQRVKQDNELHLARQELEELLAVLPRDSLSQESVQKAASKVQQRISRERARTLDAIPEWRDDAKRTDDLQGIAGMLEQYGLPANYLATVYDHRLMRFLRDSWQREQQVQRALATVKKAKGSTPASAPSKDGAPKKAAAQTRQRSGGLRGEIVNSLRNKAGI